MSRFHHIEVMRCHCPAVVIHDKSRDYSYDRFQYPPSHTTFSGRDQVAIWTPKPRNQTVKLSSSWSKNLVVIVNFQNDCKVLEYLKFHKDARTDMSHMMRSVNMSGAGVTPSWILQFLLIIYLLEILKFCTIFWQLACYWMLLFEKYQVQCFNHQSRVQVVYIFCHIIASCSSFWLFVLTLQNWLSIWFSK